MKVNTQQFFESILFAPSRQSTKHSHRRCQVGTLWHYCSLGEKKVLVKHFLHNRKEKKSSSSADKSLRGQGKLACDLGRKLFLTSRRSYVTASNWISFRFCGTKNRNFQIKWSSAKTWNALELFLECLGYEKVAKKHGNRL